MEPSGLPHDIYDLWAYAHSPAVFLLVLSVLIALALALTWWLYRRRRRDQRLTIDTPVDLRSELLSMRPSEPFNETARRQYYYQLAFTLRAILEEQMQVNATDMTTQELKLALSATWHREKSRLSELIKFLTTADAVKFGDAERSYAQAQDDHVQVCKWVNDGFGKLNPQDSIHGEA